MRRDKDTGDILSADEPRNPTETEYLLRSPANAVRLRRALKRTGVGEGESRTIESLRREFEGDSDG